MLWNVLKRQSRKLIALTLAMLVVLITFIQVDACSSFVLYGDKVFYGMNWDYYTDHDAVFTVNDAGNMKVFRMIDANEGFSPIGMNSEGMFASMQNVYPDENFNPHDKLLQNISMKDLHKYALNNCRSVDEVKSYLKDKRLNYSMVDLHDMVADINGHAMIAEAGRKSNMITENEDDFLIMTNFQNYYFKGRNYKEIYARTSEKYITAYDYILKNRDSFNIDKGFELLKSITWNGTYTTRCSFVFDPQGKEVYIAADRNFGKLWKVSIENETIETYKGFDKPMKLHVNGLRLSELKQLADYNRKAVESLNERFIVKPELSQLGTKKLSSLQLGVASAAFAIILASVVIAFKRLKA